MCIKYADSYRSTIANDTEIKIVWTNVGGWEKSEAS